MQVLAHLRRAIRSWNEKTTCLPDRSKGNAQHTYPERFGDGQLRTLQRRVSEWRREVLLLFKDSWIAEASCAGQA